MKIPFDNKRQNTAKDPKSLAFLPTSDHSGEMWSTISSIAVFSSSIENVTKIMTNATKI